MADDLIDGLRVLDEGDDTHLSSAGRTETTGFAGKHEEALFPTVWTPDAGKPAHRIATVEILLNDILDDQPEISILLIETILIF